MRVWLEGESEPSLRARITSVDDVEAPEPWVEAGGSIEDICGSVRAWLEKFVQGR